MMTISVRSVSARNGGSEAVVKVRLSSGDNFEDKVFVLSMQSYAELRVGKGEISEENFDELQRAAEIYSALKRGMNILGYGSCSGRNLVLKLRSKGVSRDVAQEAAKLLCERGYINEREDACREAERCLKKHWGARRIEAQLHSKGYSCEAIDAAMDSLVEVDFATLCAELISKRVGKIPEAEGDKRKLFSSLARYGYTPSEIKNAIEKIK